jgi:multiple sugar transport system substrate-binding protein
MTWDEAIDLGRKMTRVDGGVEYKGISIFDIGPTLINTFGLSYADNRGKVDFSNDKFAEVFRIIRRAYDNQDDYFPKGNGNLTPEFAKNLNVAMYVGNASPLFINPQTFPGLEWDIATYPTEKKGQPPRISNLGGILEITATNKHKDVSLEVAKVLESDEMNAVSLKKWENPVFMSKHISSLKVSEVSAAPINKYTNRGVIVFRNIYNEDTMASHVDKNTFYRELKEALEAEIKEMNK